MALTVGVDTYATAAQLAAYASARGIEPAGEPEVLLVKAMDYLESLEGQWQGYRTSTSQPLAWPRTGVYVYGSLQASDAVPQRIIQAQCQLAIEADSQALMPTVAAGAKGAVIEETVDVISVKYAEGATNEAPIFRSVTAIVKPLYKTAGGGSNFAVTRV
jgi:hypothetical protein